AYELIPGSTYPAGHPYSWSVIGSMEDLNAASLEDVKDWFRTYYGPSNTVIVLAGDIDAKTAREKVTRYFGDIPAGPPVARQQAWPAKMTGVHRQQVQDRVPQARVFKIWNVPGFGTADTDYLDLASDILTKGKVSRLYKRLVYTDQLATAVSCFIDTNEIGSQFTIDATARPGQDPAKLEKAIDEEVARLLSAGPTPEELKRVQTQYAANFLRGMQRIGGFGGKSDLLAQAEVYTRDPAYLFKTSFNRHVQATPAEVKAAASHWLADGQFVLEVLPFPEYTTVTSNLDRSKPPEASGIPELKLPKLERATLANGMKIILAQRHEAPMVNFWLLEDAGYAADSTTVSGTASMTSEMLPFGTRTHNTLEIDEQVESLGARLNSYANIDLSTVELSALKSNLEPSIALFADVVMNPAFPAADFTRLQRQHLAAIQQEKVTPFLMGLRVLPPLLFGPGHAYGVPYTGTGTEASVAQMKPEDLAKFHAAWFRPNNATLVIVGDTTLPEITPKIERAFAAWQPGKPPVKNIAAVRPPDRPQTYLIDRPGSEQTVILTGLIAPPKAHNTDIPLQIMNVVLGGTFGARLNMNLREDKHYSYGAGSVLLGARAQRPYIGYAPVQTDKTKEALAEMFKEFQGITGAQPITAGELEHLGQGFFRLVGLHRRV
ncbi:MAG TPA: pitrilysin family protein, partial [Candidatus Solibacter sp.]|nr:pitrilysin family protein [Candidatus Solibacter sp.]